MEELLIIAHQRGRNITNNWNVRKKFDWSHDSERSCKTGLALYLVAITVGNTAMSGVSNLRVLIKFKFTCISQGSDQLWDPSTLLYKSIGGSFPRSRPPRFTTDHPFLSSVEIKNVWSHASIRLHGMVFKFGDNFAFYFLPSVLRE